MPLLQTSFMIGLFVCLYASVRGAGYERKGALLYGLVLGLNTVLLNNGWFFAHPLTLTAAMVGLIGFVALCWKSPHPWPLWAAAAQAMALMGQVLSLTNTRITPVTADIIQHVALYITLFSLLMGTIYAQRQRKKKPLSSVVSHPNKG